MTLRKSRMQINMNRYLFEYCVITTVNNKFDENNDYAFVRYSYCF